MIHSASFMEPSLFKICILNYLFHFIQTYLGSQEQTHPLCDVIGVIWASETCLLRLLTVNKQI